MASLSILQIHLLLELLYYMYWCFHYNYSLIFANIFHLPKFYNINLRFE
nr:MAG TPA: hypothetical protein [Bacteriophage sp.]